MKNIMDSPLLVLVVSLAVLWLSSRTGIAFRERRKLEEAEHEDFVLIVSATLTLLALIIGFSFSMAISRYDQRKNYEESEANAIGTEYVRADMLPAADASRVRALLKNYLNQRILSIPPAMNSSAGKSARLRLNCRPSYGPRSRLQLRPSRPRCPPSSFRV